MQPSHAMGEFVEQLWQAYEPDAHFDGYRLLLRHPEYGLLLTQDEVDFVQRHVMWIPDILPEFEGMQQVTDSFLPSLEMRFHINGRGAWHPYQISDADGLSQKYYPSLPNLSAQFVYSQEDLASFADQWAETLHAQRWLTEAHQCPSELAALLSTQQRWQPQGDTLRQQIQAIIDVEKSDRYLVDLSDNFEIIGVTRI